jgi:hypothetical protein
MCTVIYHHNLNLLCKNRDKESPVREEVVSTSDYAGIKTKGSDYLSLGVNRHGVAFVTTAVNPPSWTQAVEKGNSREAAHMLNLAHQGLVRASVDLTLRFPEMKTVKDIVELLTETDRRYIPYNIVCADLFGGFRVELCRDQRAVDVLSEKDTVTNHFIWLDYGPKTYSDYPSTFNRYEEVRDRLNDLGCVEDVERLLFETFGDVDRAIWRTGIFSTVSCSMIDLGNRRITVHAMTEDGKERSSKTVSIRE